MPDAFSIHMSQIRNTEDRLTFKLREAATALGVSPTSVRRAIKRGLIRPTIAFRHVLISREELERFIRENTLEQTEVLT